MENKSFDLKGVIPNLIKNTHLNIKLEGWPAACTFIVVCGTLTACYAIKTFAAQSN